MGAYSRPHMLAKIDGRLKGAWLLRRIQEELTDHIGGNPTVTQRIIIERASIVALRLSYLDQKILDDEEFTILDNNQYLAWANSLTRMLQRLGIKETGPKPNQLP